MSMSTKIASIIAVLGVGVAVTGFTGIDNTVDEDISELVTLAKGYKDQIATEQKAKGDLQTELDNIDEAIEDEGGLLDKLGITQNADGTYSVTANSKADGNVFEQMNFLKQEVGKANNEIDRIEGAVQSAIEEVEGYTGVAK